MLKKNHISLEFANLILNTIIESLESFKCTDASSLKHDFSYDSSILIQIPIPIFIFNKNKVIWKNKIATDFFNRNFQSSDKIQNLLPQNKFISKKIFPFEATHNFISGTEVYTYLMKKIHLFEKNYKIGLYINNYFFEQGFNYIQLNLLFLQQLLKEANTGYLIFNQNNQLKSYNSKAQNLLDIHTDIKNKTITDIFYPLKSTFKKSEFSSLCESQIKKQSQNIFITEIKGENENQIIQIRKNLIQNPNANYISFIIDNISDISYHAKMLKKKNRFFKLLSISGSKLLKTKTVEGLKKILIEDLSYIFERKGSYYIFNSDFKIISSKFSERLKLDFSDIQTKRILEKLLKHYSKRNIAYVELSGKIQKEIYLGEHNIHKQLKDMKWDFAYIRSLKKIYYQVVIIYPQNDSQFIKNFLYSLFLQFNNRLSEILHQKEVLKKSKTATELNKAKSKFVSNISHEIKNPISSIIGFAELLEARLEKPELKKMATIIRKNSQHLLNIIQDLSDISKIESNTLRIFIEKVDVFAIFEEIQDLFRNYKEINPNIELRFHYEMKGNLYINADFTRIKQIIINFLTNALKYTDFGYIDIGYEVTDNNVKIYVKDTGRGMSEEMQQTIFNRFERGEYNFNRKIEGVGIGLTISKELAHRMKAQINVESQIGEGSIFSISIEKYKNKETSNKINKIEKKSPSDKKFLLVVEDDEATNQFYHFLLTSFHINFKICKSASEAEKIIETKTPELMITDVRMAEKTGIELIETNLAKLKNTKIYIITADADPDIQKKVLDLNVEGILIKPVAGEKIKSLLEKNGFETKI